MNAPLVAAIDCGTNSTRLLVSDGASTAERLMTVTRLGRDVDATGSLAPDAIARTLEVLAGYRDRMEHHGVRSVRVAATSAVRDARNSADFTGPAEELLGVAPEVLSGGEEAELSFLGATRDLPDSGGPYLVVDIGGGSTEFAMGTSAPEAAASVRMGCVRMTEKCLHADPPLPEELTNCLAEVASPPGLRALGFSAIASKVPGILGKVVHEVRNGSNTLTQRQQNLVCGS